MFKRILISLALLTASFSCFAAKDVLTVGFDNNSKTYKITPAYTNMQINLYPVFSFIIPEGYTDFELKATVTNFKAPDDTDISDKPTDHVGEEVVFYYNSQFPYIGNTGSAPYQKFDIDRTFVYFQATKVIKFSYKNTNNEFVTTTFSGNWDSRRYIMQVISNNILTNTSFSISSYLANPSNNRVGGVMVVIGFEKDTTLANNIKPTNINLMWSISFTNLTQPEQDNNGIQIWHPITPTNWISDCSFRLPNLQ